MKLILEYWKNYIKENKEGPFYVAKRDKKIKGKTHYVVMHRPSGTYVPSNVYKMGRASVQGLVDELNAYNKQNDGILDDPNLPNTENVKKVLDIVRNSEHKEDNIDIQEKQAVSEVFGLGYLEYIVNAAKNSVKEHNQAEGSNSVTLVNKKRGSDLQLSFQIRTNPDYNCQVVLVPDEGGIGIQIACAFKKSVDNMVEKQFFENLQNSLPNNLKLSAMSGGGVMITGYQKLDRTVQKNIAQALKGSFSYVLSKLQESYDEISGGAQTRSVRKSF